MTTPAILCAPVLLFVQAVSAQIAAPVFTGFSTPVDHLQANHQVLLKSPQSRRYATLLRQAAMHPLNFAGHYVLATVGCGASCVLVAAIEAQTGTVMWVPFHRLLLADGHHRTPRIQTRQLPPRRPWKPQ